MLLAPVSCCIPVPYCIRDILIEHSCHSSQQPPARFTVSGNNRMLGSVLNVEAASTREKARSKQDKMPQIAQGTAAYSVCGPGSIRSSFSGRSLFSCIFLLFELFCREPDLFLVSTERSIYDLLYGKMAWAKKSNDAATCFYRFFRIFPDYALCRNNAIKS